MLRKRTERELKKVFIVVRQAGTLNAFLPLVPLIESGGGQVHVFVFRQLAEALCRKNAGFKVINSFRDAQVLMEKLGAPSLILTGTSFSAEEDFLFWRWADRQGVPSMAFVDSWVNYACRFSSGLIGTRPFNLLPDRIGVIDRAMRDGLLQAGAPAEKIVIVGNPAFDALSDRARLGHELNLDASFRAYAGRRYFLFVDEPFNSALGPDEKTYYGYTGNEVLRLFLAALDKMGQDSHERPLLIIKPHPIRGQCRDISAEFGLEGPRKNLDLAFSNVPGQVLAAKAQMVFGMTSMLLLEAAMMGVPVISLQPGRRRPNAVTDDRRGIAVICRPAELCAVISRGVNRSLRATASAAGRSGPRSVNSEIFYKKISSLALCVRQR